MDNSSPRRDYKQILVEWANSHDISPVQLQQLAGFSYQHAWDLLRGKREVTAETIGRILTSLPPELGSDLYKAIVVPNNTLG